jgi:hypothetical protein
MSAWLYTISETAGRTFDLVNGTRIPVNYENYVNLIREERLHEDKHWGVWRRFGQIEIGDEIYIYMGSGNRGIIGYGVVESKRGQRQGSWEISLSFNYGRCLSLIAAPIPATVVRAWFRPHPGGRTRMLNTVEPLDAFAADLRGLLPW